MLFFFLVSMGFLRFIISICIENLLSYPTALMVSYGIKGNCFVPLMNSDNALNPSPPVNTTSGNSSSSVTNNNSTDYKANNNPWKPDTVQIDKILTLTRTICIH